MTTDSRFEVISDLFNQIKGDPRGWKQRTVATFLRQLGIKRLTAKSVSEIDTLLSLNSLQISDDGTGRPWHKRSRREMLTFMLAPRLELEAVFDDSGAEEFLSEDPVSPARLRRSQNKVASMESNTRKDPNLSLIPAAKGDNPLPLFRHQQDAVQKLDNKLPDHSRAKRFAGLLVIPTGGGKTRTAVHWVLRNVVNRGGKVLWIAHRHELLEQARSAFEKNAYEDVLSDRDRISCRVVSGVHSQPVKITSDDDIVVASVHSVRPGSSGARHLVNKWLRDNKDVFLVIDEAHHAPARTYRQLIDVVEENSSRLRMLGLTATPFRTAKSEQGHLKALFPDDIVFRVGLNKLISRGILSEPLFRTPETRINLRDELELTDADMRRLRKSNFNLDMLGERAQRKLAENRRRNRFIVDHFLSKRSDYGQTLVFAANVLNAIALNHLFVQDGVKSEVVIGNIQEMKRARNISPTENKEAIQRFRDGETNVLINVNILTEGTDLPNVKTVFLTRPTTSKTLMMQMIGRGLRGPKVKDAANRSSGTKETYIVSFIVRRQLLFRFSDN